MPPTPNGAPLGAAPSPSPEEEENQGPVVQRRSAVPQYDPAPLAPIPVVARSKPYVQPATPTPDANRYSDDPTIRAQQATDRMDAAFADKQRAQNPFIFSNAITKLSDVGGRRYTDRAVQKANTDYSEQVLNDRRAAVNARKAEIDAQKDAQMQQNAQREAHARGTGQRIYKDEYGNWQPELDPSGRPLYFKSEWEDSVHPRTGEPVQEMRDQHGQRQFRSHPVIVDPDPAKGKLYYDTGQGPVEIGDAAALISHSNPKVAAAARKALTVQRQAQTRDALLPAQQLHREVQGKFDDATAQINPSADPSNPSLADQKAAIETQLASINPGGVFGVGEDPTLAAKRDDLQNKRDQLQTRIDWLTDATAKGTGQLWKQAAMAKLGLARTKLKAEHDAYGDNGVMRATLLRQQGKTEEEIAADPFVQQSVAQQSKRAADIRQADNLLAVHRGPQAPEAPQADGQASAPAAAISPAAAVASPTPPPEAPVDIKKAWAGASPLERLKMMMGVQRGNTEIKEASPIIGSEAAGTEGALFTIPKAQGDSKEAGMMDAANKFTAGLTSPENVALMAAGGFGSFLAKIGQGTRIGLAAKTAGTAAHAGFTAQMTRDTIANAKEAWKVVNDPKATDKEKADAITGTILSGVMAGAAGHGAVESAKGIRGDIRRGGLEPPTSAAPTPPPEPPGAPAVETPQAAAEAARNLSAPRVPRSAEDVAGIFERNPPQTEEPLPPVKSAADAAQTLDQVRDTEYAPGELRPSTAEEAAHVLAREVPQVPPPPATPAAESAAAILEAQARRQTPAPTLDADAVARAGPSEGGQSPEQAQRQEALFPSDTPNENARPVRDESPRPATEVPPRQSQQASPDVPAGEVVAAGRPPVTTDPATIAKDRREYDMLNKRMQSLVKDGKVSTPEFQSAWAKLEAIKNRHGGMPPGEVSGGTPEVRAESARKRGKEKADAGIVPRQEWTEFRKARDEIRTRDSGDSKAAPEKVASAAIRTNDGEIISTPTHAQAAEKAMTAGKEWGTSPNDEGFVTKGGKYVTREDAAKLQGKEGRLKAEDVSPKAELRKALKDIDESTGTGSDLADAIENIESGELPEELVSAAADYRNAINEHYDQWGGRMDTEEASSDALRAAVEKYLGREKEAKSAPTKPVKPVRADVSAIEKATTPKELYTVAGKMIREENDPAKMKQMQAALQKRAAELENPAPPKSSAELKKNNAGIDQKPVSSLSQAEKRAELDSGGVKTYNGKSLNDLNPAELSNAVGKMRRGELTSDGPTKIESAISRLDAEIKKYSGDGKTKMDPRSERGSSDLHTAAYVGALKVARAVLAVGHSIEKAVSYALQRYRALNPKHTDEELKMAETDIKDALSPKAPPPKAKEAAKAPSVSSPAKAETTGIAHRVTETRGSDAPRGEGVSTEDSIKRGRELLKTGYDADKALADFSKDGKISADAVAAARAKAEDLSRATNKAYDEFGENSPQGKAAWEAEKKWIEQVKPLQTEWHKIGQAQQGETEIDTGTFHGMKKAFFQATGKDMTENQEGTARRLAGQVKDATEKADDLKNKVLEAVGTDKDKTAAQNKALVQLHETGKPWTPQQAKALWQSARENYLNKGVTNFDDIRHGLAADFGLPVQDVTNGLASPKGLRPITDDMYAKMAQSRRVINQAKQWIADAKYPGYEKAFKAVPRWFFNLATLGHGTVWGVTHSPSYFFQPDAMKAQWQNLGRAFKLMGAFDKGAYHEQMMQDLVRDPNFIKAKRAGLANDPFKYQDDYQNADTVKFFKNLGLMGNRGFDGLKLLRQQRFNEIWDKTPASLQTSEMAKMVADDINTATGVVNNARKFSIANAPNWLLFAPKLEASRWKYLMGDPAKAASTFADWKNKSPEERQQAVSQVKQKAAVAGVYLGALALNQAVLSASGSKQQVNFTNPMRGDWLSFKALGENVGIMSPSITAVRYLARLAHDAMGPRSEFEVMQSSRFEEATKDAGKYARTKLAPFSRIATDSAFQTDSRDRPMPWNNNPISFRARSLGVTKKYSTPEYIGENAIPIPFQEAVADTMKSQGMGRSDIETFLHALTIAAIAGTAGAHVNEDTSLLPHKAPRATVAPKEKVFEQ